MNSISDARPVHRLKTHVEPFRAAWIGNKLHEVRKADRDFKPGDLVQLVEFDQYNGVELGREIRARITYLSGAGTYGLPVDVCVFTFLVLERVRP